MPVEDLPSIDNFFTVRYQRSVAYELASNGQKDAIMMLKQQGLIDPDMGTMLYQGAGEAGSIDMIRWLHCPQIVTWQYKAIYETAIYSGCTEVMDYLLTKLDDLSIESGLQLTPDTRFECRWDLIRRR
ncbi:hypothetical protein PROFUN_15798 [Planoprotostelium fungivorum]|uniref:Ankyrin repeat protein n=1 Tax=Planoprotostelium fungivorum TaxID=1890364 RepID=A0A2P6MUA6_9EUKA|nr:hypothetical protein PROFUN_15798 [Planoprotostelium fungivorum]